MAQQRKTTVVTFVVVALSTFLMACGNSAARKSEYISRGDEFLKADKIGEALIEYRQAVQLDDRDGQARQKLGRAYLTAGDVAKAMDELVRAADLLPDDAEAQLEAARILMAVGRFEDARSRADKVLIRDHKNVAAIVLKANATAGLREPEEAQGLFEQAVTLDPNRSTSYIELATIQATRGQQAQAEAGFKQAIVTDPKSMTAYLALANFYWLTARTKEAEEVLLKALAIDPINRGANLSLANLYQATNRSAEMEAPLKRIADASEDPRPRLTLADYYIARRRPKEARPILETLAKRQDSAAAAKARLAGIEYEAGARDTAYKLIDALVAEYPRSAQILTVKGRWLRLETKAEEALAVAQAATKGDPKSIEAWSLLGAVQLTRNKREEAIAAYEEVLHLRPAAYDARIALASLHLALGRVPTALTFARDAMQAAPRDAGARFTLAEVLLADRRFEEALKEVKLVLESNPTFAAGLALQGRIQTQAGDAAGARRSFAQALEIEPGLVTALTGLMTLDLREKRSGEAIGRLEARLSKDPRNPRLLVIAGRTYALTGDLAKSEDALRKAIDIDPSMLEAYHVLGQIFVRQKKLDEARRAYDERAKAQPRDVTAHTMAGMILLVQGKQAEARARFEQVLSIDSTAPVAANNLAYMDAEAGTNLDLALGRAQAAKAAQPDDPNVSDTLGWVFVKRDMPSMAIPPLELAVEKDPSNPLYHYHLGIAYSKADRKQAARSALERALTLSPNFEGAGNARQALAALR